MKPIHFAALLLLGAIWGASFLFISLAVAEFGPLALMFLRVLIAGSILAAIAFLAQRKNQPRPTLNLRANWRKYLTVGLLNSALPFTLIAFSELKLTVSLAAILNATTPLFTVLLAAVWGHERVTGRKALGVLLGIFGVSVLVGGGPLKFGPEMMLAVLASLLAACCYGAGTVYAAKNISGLPPVYASMVQLLSAAVLLALPAAMTLLPSAVGNPPPLPSARAAMALLALILLSTSFAYLLYFFLLRNVGPTRTASVTFLVPIFGSIWGIIFLHEPFNAGSVFGMAIVFASIGLVTTARIAAPVRQGEHHGTRLERFVREHRLG